MLAGCTINKTTVNNYAKKPVAENNKQSADIAYTNTKLGFSLTFPATWKGYITNESNNGVSFGFAEQKNLFSVVMYSRSEWQKIKSQDGPTPNYLGENSQSVFGYSTAQDGGDGAMIERMREIPNIVKTFKPNLALENNKQSADITYTDIQNKFSFQYPPTLSVHKIDEPSSSQGVILLSPDYQGEGKDTPTWDEVKSGYKIAVRTIGVPQDWGGWVAWVDRPGGAFGELVMREPDYLLGNRRVYKRVAEGNGFANEYSDQHTLTFFAIPNESESKTAEIWLLAKTKDSENYQSVIENIVNSFKWK